MTATVAPRYSLDAVARVIEEQPSARVVDLVSVAAHIYAADRSTPRGRDWTRHIQLQLHVSAPRLWMPVQAGLTHALSVLTDDEWDLDFVEGRTALGVEQQAWLALARKQPPTAIALFSGGLDSFAGAARWLEEHPHESLGLLSLCSSTVVAKVQRDLVARLGEAYPGRISALRVPLNLIKAPDVERSQRTRGLLYTAIASAAADWSGAKRVLIFENGYGSLNPRLAEHQRGAQATKSTHPFVLHLLEQAYHALGLQVLIELPYGGYTKAELLTGIPDRLKDAIRLTVSCDGFPQRLKDVKQCGSCGSCILRQQSLKSAGLAMFDRTDYKSPAFEAAPPADHLRLMAFQAWQLMQASVPERYARAAMTWPEIALGAPHQASLDVIARLGVLRRYGLEWARLIANDQLLGDRLGWSNIE